MTIDSNSLAITNLSIINKKYNPYIKYIFNYLQ